MQSMSDLKFAQERRRFERVYKKRHPRSTLDTNLNGSYMEFDVNEAWIMWQLAVAQPEAVSAASIKDRDLRNGASDSELRPYFESAYRRRHPDTAFRVDRHGNYVDYDVKVAWTLWQLVAELPELTQVALSYNHDVS